MWEPVNTMENKYYITTHKTDDKNNFKIIIYNFPQTTWKEFK